MDNGKNLREEENKEVAANAGEPREENIRTEEIGEEALKEDAAENRKEEDSKEDGSEEDSKEDGREEEDTDIGFADDIVEILRSGKSAEELCEILSDYHDNDIALALQQLDREERKKIYPVLGVERVSDIFSYIDDVSEYLEEITMEQAADVLENMDADDAVDALSDIENEDTREQLISLMEPEASEDIRLISSYDEDEIGSMMTTNFIAIGAESTVKQAMKSMIGQAKENDNINTIYVVDGEEKYYGAIDLADLIIARDYTQLESIISKNYPSVKARAKIGDTIDDLRGYAEDSIPVLDDDDKLIGIITSQDIVEAVDDEMGEDYAKLAGLTAEEDLHEKMWDSIKKRIPWLALLLVLGLGVSSVVGIFEDIVAEIAIITSFQALILGMAGNVGTQSLAVTIRVLMDENVSGGEKFRFVFKEIRIGGANGLLLGMISFLFVGLYLHFIKDYIWIQAFEISGCVGLAMFLAMVIASLVGTIIPMFFHKIKVDPAVASGPLITTVNDLIAVVAYYGLAGILLVGRI